jgi:SEC-C motif
MGRKPFPRNESCPCGSGEKYKRCCVLKGFHYYLDEENGACSGSVPLNQEAPRDHIDVLPTQREKLAAPYPGPQRDENHSSAADLWPHPRVA